MRRFTGITLAALLVLGLGIPLYDALAASSGAQTNPAVITISGTATSTSALVSLGTVRLGGRYPVIGVTVKVTDANDGIDDFKVRVRSSRNGDWVDIYSGTDWADTSVMEPEEKSGTDQNGNGHHVHQLVAGEYCRLKLNLGPTDEVDFLANADGNTTTVTIMGYAQ